MKNSKRAHIFTVLAAMVAVCLMSLPLQAAVFDFTAVIDGAQADAGAGTGSPGTGSATAQYDDVTGDFSWDISWSGLLSPETVMHFHGPALPNQNAGVQVNFGAISGTTSPSIGSTVINATQGADLLNDLWYINIHTEQFPGGEIRGQVLLVPEPATYGLTAAMLAGGLLWWRRRRYV